MINIKKIIADTINYSGEINLEDLIIESASKDKGDYCLPCFTFSKILKKSPQAVAEDFQKSLKPSNLIEKTEVVNGYLNFFLNVSKLSSIILDSSKSENLIKLANEAIFDEGKGKVICVDYGSPNLAKYLHIGHLKTLIIGESLCRLFELFGYTVKRLNFVGDYGTPFGKIIGGIQLFGSMEEVINRGNDALQDYYVKFNQLEEKDEKYSQMARDIFKKIENRDEKVYPIYKKIVEISLADAVEKFKLLGVTFDDYRGEMYYNQFVPKLIEKLTSLNLLSTSQGAKIVDLSAYDMPPAIMIKSDGTTLYASRDLTASMLRYEDYKFDKMIYLTAVEQILHFKQWFKVSELMKADYSTSLEHVAYGRFSLPEGKISSRRGKQAVLVDLLEYVLEKAKDVIKDRQFTIEKPEDVANKVSRAVLNYSVLKVERSKDCVFDVEKSFSFEGETAPYMQYTYTRIESILRKSKLTINSECDYSCFNSDAFDIVKMINDFPLDCKTALIKRDPSFVAKRVMDLCKAFNKFYASTKVLEGTSQEINAKISLLNKLKDTLKQGFNLICIDTLQEM